jgi:cytochrome o ubiquinol oxidase operon protein cyoD
MSEASRDRTDDAMPGESAGDRSPGDPGGGPGRFRQGLKGYLLGLALAAGLTIASFTAAATGLLYGPAVPFALAALAIGQMGIHLVFFLHMTTDPDNTNNALALAFGVLIVFLVMAGSLWIMNHLDSTMMPMSRMIEMQR